MSCNHLNNFQTSCDVNFRENLHKKMLSKLHKISTRFHNSGLLYKVKYLEHLKFEIHFLSAAANCDEKERLRNWRRRRRKTRGWSGEICLMVKLFYVNIWCLLWTTKLLSLASDSITRPILAHTWINIEKFYAYSRFLLDMRTLTLKKSWFWLWETRGLGLISLKGRW